MDYKLAQFQVDYSRKQYILLLNLKEQEVYTVRHRKLVTLEFHKIALRFRNKGKLRVYYRGTENTIGWSDAYRSDVYVQINSTEIKLINRDYFFR